MIIIYNDKVCFFLCVDLPFELPQPATIVSIFTCHLPEYQSIHICTIFTKYTEQ